MHGDRLTKVEKRVVNLILILVQRLRVYGFRGIWKVLKVDGAVY